MRFTRRRIAATLASLALLGAPPALGQSSEMASWNDGAAKRAIQAFVNRVTTPGPDFVAPNARIAVFDNDGTLWVEQPVYTEVVFSLQRAAEMARSDPTLAARPAFKAALSGDRAQLAALKPAEILDLMVATHSDVTTEAFEAAAKAWLETARHPKLDRPYREAVYKPMLELLRYLRSRGFKVFIVSGGDADFMRAYAQDAYRIPPDQVIGSSSETRFTRQDGRWVLVRTGKMTVDDKATKPSNIALHIGRRPILAVGNSDGDLQMLQYVTAGDGPRMGVLIHHDDAQREYAYDRASRVGTLDKALDAAGPAGWTVVSMKTDWNTVFSPNFAADLGK